ncbi:MAG: hypothetical protein ACKOQY_04770 [Bacteroidota bacterium]
MDESELPDSDHPFKEDITAEEFRQLINESAMETIKVKALKPRLDEDWHVQKQAILDAMNSSENPC